MAEMTVRDRGGHRTAALVDDSDALRLSRFVGWCVMPSGFVARHQQVNGSRRVFYLHREVVGATHGDGLRVEHVNGRRLDNRRANLRLRAGRAGLSPASRTRAATPDEPRRHPDMSEAW